ncbi:MULTISPECIES: TonB-dependent receptor [unclassified Novosphingobium]|uniref:TonB-dependent receptor n=1 Tax=unclassified Novosphingobium TaxID=2644732 RepID=UPI001358FD10|nr:MULTISPECIES: TonB-dependent receptor [unclassified Novosphingobium]
MAYRPERLRLHAWLAAASTSTLALSTPVFAQATPPAEVQAGALEEIVVTAQRRAENLQAVPIAIAAVTADALSRAGVNDTNSLSQVVPSVNFQRSGASGLFFVRGVGTTNASVGDEGSNAFYVDGVYIPDLSGTVTQFNNISRIEVLKGPQGTLFGRNAFGGLIHIITKEPGDVFETQGEAGYSNYQTVQGKLYVGGPVTENVSMDLALTGYDQSKGWGRNITLNRDTKKMRYWGARSKLVWRASDAVKVTLAGDYYKNDDNTAIAWSVDQDFPVRGLTGPIYSVGSLDTAADQYSLTKLKSWGVSATIEADLGFANLTSISSLRDSKNNSDFDVDATQIPWLRITFESGSRAYQQELRLASADTDPLSWQIGAFYLRSEVDNASRFRGLAAGGVNGGTFIDATLNTDSYAAFGELSYKLTPTTQVIGGVRYTKDKRVLGGGVYLVANNTLGAFTPTNDSIDYGKFTYRLAVRQELTDDISLYASYNRGFKAGTYSLQSPTNPPVQPQYINAYEAGVKSELFGRRLRLNASAFHYDISNYQIRSAAAGAIGAAVLLNAASVKVDGVDVEFDAAPMKNLRIFGGFTWLDSRFSNFGKPGSTYQAPFIYPNPAVCNATGTADPGTTTGPYSGGLTTCFGNASGFQTPGAPDFTASVGTSLTVPVNETGELRFSLLGSYNSGFPFESDGLLRQKKYALLNGSVAYWLTENWGVEVWGKNITGTKYFQQKISTGLGATTNRAAPATYGVTIKFDY